MFKLLYGSASADKVYALGLAIHDPIFILETPQGKLVFLDSREIGYFKQKGNPKVKPILADFLIQKAKANTESVCFDARLALEIVTAYVKEKEITVPEYFPVAIADYLRGKGYTLETVGQFYPEREVKTKTEIQNIESALDRTKKAFVRVEEILSEATISGTKVLWHKKPLTSEFLKREILQVFARENLDDALGMIVASGKHSALVHHRGDGLIRANESIVVDLFPRDRESGYFADMTRTYVKGKPSARIQKMYDAVLEAKNAVIAEVCEGKPAKELHELCCSILKKHGFHTGSRGFTHATGHGVGLDIHEAPRIGLGPDILKAGQVITIEPGLYYENIGGIRLEDMILVTKKGGQNLTNYPSTFEL